MLVTQITTDAQRNRDSVKMEPPVNLSGRPLDVTAQMDTMVTDVVCDRCVYMICNSDLFYLFLIGCYCELLFQK